MPTPQQTVDAVRSYLRTHPEELGRAVRSALGLRFGIPLAALRWLGQQAERSGKVEDFHIDAVPPGLRLSGNLDAMNTPIRASAIIFVERVVFNDEELTVALRLEEVMLKLNGESDSPVAALIKSGALDLSNPGTLVNFMPGRSPVLAEANGNRIVLDLMRDPNIGKNPLVRRAVSLLTSFVTLHGVETDTKHLDIAFRALPTGLGGAAQSIRKNIVLPSMSRLLPRAR
ncbi:MAG: hypothetical protein JRG67_02780 [Deltaproteobacteria bacterium]|nr:hypothetical protein [Deltaproteobacteria bacterium]MBW2209960.1 hypothetical protein [Deltaproteobacteria bacterium]MBW2379898.1 hypothetical protein [Deltaproteobacteria bacterium]MBW2550638.1 hypothetical protein [Deltaproteobacteria bacterium]MBW2627845.1 hypothetical protein [Deltaproteobacteria bacterium]